MSQWALQMLSSGAIKGPFTFKLLIAARKILPATLPLTFSLILPLLSAWGPAVMSAALGAALLPTQAIPVVSTARKGPASVRVAVFGILAPVW